MKIKKHIPNIITLLNLFSGCIALLFATKHNYNLALLFVGIGIFFDFFDGFFARIFKVQSNLGLQLDSLADMVTSGLVPGFVMYLFISDHFSTYYSINYIALFGFVITLASCYRLAKFNIDTRQTNSFIGLPTPANALFILSLPILYETTDIVFIKELLSNYVVLIVISFLSALMLNAEIMLFSLKFKNFTFSKNKIQIVFILLSIILLAVLKLGSIPIIILSCCFVCYKQ